MLIENGDDQCVMTVSVLGWRLSKLVMWLSFPGENWMHFEHLTLHLFRTTYYKPHLWHLFLYKYLYCFPSLYIWNLSMNSSDSTHIWHLFNCQGFALKDEKRRLWSIGIPKHRLPLMSPWLLLRCTYFAFNSPDICKDP